LNKGAEQMKSESNFHRHVLLVIVLVLGCAMIGGVPVFAAGVTSSALPSNATPAQGQTITVPIVIDMSAAGGAALGGFTGTLDWNPAILTYSSNSGLPAGFTGYVNIANAGSGHIIFNGANASGATGNITVVTITFNVVGAGTSALDLGYSAMAAASTFANLLPELTITDGSVTSLPTAVTLATVKASSVPWLGIPATVGMVLGVVAGLAVAGRQLARLMKR
jgi:hypothetical protein